MRIVNGTHYHDGTPQGAIAVLESARMNGYRIQVHYGTPKTGQDWLEEHGTAGTIGRSCGPVKVPLMIATPRSTGGDSILDHCVLRITRRRDGRKVELYRHPNYKNPCLSIVPSNVVGYSHAILRLGEGIIANFRTRLAAVQYVERFE